MLKDLINPAQFNIMVGKLGDVLVKALDKPLGYAINWGRTISTVPIGFIPSASTCNCAIVNSFSAAVLLPFTNSVSAAFK